ncbi:hypothetical protein BB560_001503 [Smittium megazygosporum]|uniref:Uncharacterized protein n=1 Tax=Smittium megazygosporum TaxID=133381 RepID=A0A2T9ZHF1_9FUNG|nr:hypothetical protein BB560_001503 [Smittium megazygosporum]
MKIVFIIKVLLNIFFVLGLPNKEADTKTIIKNLDPRFQKLGNYQKRTDGSYRKKIIITDMLEQCHKAHNYEMSQELAKINNLQSRVGLKGACERTDFEELITLVSDLRLKDQTMEGCIEQVKAEFLVNTHLFSDQDTDLFSRIKTERDRLSNMILERDDLYMRIYGEGFSEGDECTGEFNQYIKETKNIFNRFLGL